MSGPAWIFFAAALVLAGLNLILSEALSRSLTRESDAHDRASWALAELIKAKTANTVSAFDLFRERRAGIDRTRAEIQALPELGDGAS